MTEDEYWSRLEYRLCYEMTGVDEWYRARYWCDGIYPTELRLDQAPPVIQGQAWIGWDSGMESWKFELVLPRAFAARELLPWEELLPPDDQTGWLDLDTEHKCLRIEPAIAIPDEA